MSVAIERVGWEIVFASSAGGKSKNTDVAAGGWPTQQTCRDGTLAGAPDEIVERKLLSWPVLCQRIVQTT